MPAKENIEPLVKLTADQQKELEELGSTIKKADDTLALMKELGIDTTEMQGTLDRAKATRELLLKRFSVK